MSNIISLIIFLRAVEISRKGRRILGKDQDVEGQKNEIYSKQLSGHLNEQVKKKLNLLLKIIF